MVAWRTGTTTRCSGCRRGRQHRRSALPIGSWLTCCTRTASRARPRLNGRSLIVGCVRSTQRGRLFRTRRGAPTTTGRWDIRRRVPVRLELAAAGLQHPLRRGGVTGAAPKRPVRVDRVQIGRVQIVRDPEPRLLEERVPQGLVRRPAAHRARARDTPVGQVINPEIGGTATTPTQRFFRPGLPISIWTNPI